MCSPRRTLLTALPLLSACVACAAGTPLSRMPDAAGVERLGYRVSTEGGEEAPTSTFIPAKRERSGSPAPATARTPMPPATSASDGVRNAQGGRDTPAETGKFFHTRTETDDPDAALNKVSRREGNLSERRFAGKANDLLGEKYAGKENIRYDKWGRGSDNFEKGRNESVDMDSRFGAERIDKNRVQYDRVERKSYEKSGDKADVRNWGEHRPHDLTSKYSDKDNRASFADRMSDGYSLLSQVSMQDINRYQYRRNRSDEKGALPVAKPGKEASAMPSAVR